jgi:calcineurin-like phosphoesterase family protein
MLWHTSDIHAGHSNILHLCGRPFGSLYEMEQAIIRNWNAVVKPEDQVIIVGDVAFKCDTTHAINILKQLNGRIALVIGNHDHKYLKDPNFCACFEWIKDYYTFQHNKRLYVVNHFPFLSWDGMGRGSVNLCGHRHLRQQEEGNVLRIDVGMDAWQFKPVSIDQLEALVATRSK